MKIYTDGSFIAKLTKDASGFASVFVLDETDNEYYVDIYYGVITGYEYVNMWNVGGELFAAIYGIDTAINVYNANNIDIYHDYIGIDHWTNGKWKCSRTLTQGYRHFVNNKRDLVDINFHHVKAHSGNQLNNVADKYASFGIREFVRTGMVSFTIEGLVIDKLR